ncbi:hypothetical protein LTR17_012577 [Elasticomyces elasticus]|nr:hypothetical protein LTR17_012577 [Elasticomyces elasticus]
MLSIKASITALVAVSTAVAIPTPQVQAGNGTQSFLSVNLSIPCGCWNICTLNQRFDPSVTCPDTSCDPLLLCVTLNPGGSNDRRQVDSTPIGGFDPIKLGELPTLPLPLIGGDPTALSCWCGCSF